MNKLNRATALKIARFAAQGKYQDIIDILQQFPNTNPRTWGGMGAKLIPFLKDTDSPAPFKIFTKGNSKLPFYSFSNLPLVNCPGKGDCAKWCYSLKAWQYPAAFLRQVQNTILVREQSRQLSLAWMKLPKDTDVRLYVDGDIDSMETMEYWFTLMKLRNDLKIYGYSKSWEIFLDYSDSGKPFPTNYVLNLSSGSKYQNIGPIRARMKALPIVRGEFVAVPAGNKPNAQTVKQVARQFGMKKIFVCPGKCGTCISKQGKNIHACGSMLLQNSNIVIGVH